MRKIKQFWFDVPENERRATTLAEISQVEASLQIKLPHSYCEIMLMQNGGYPTWSFYWEAQKNQQWNNVFQGNLHSLSSLETLANFEECIDFGDDMPWSDFIDDTDRLIIIANHSTAG